MSKRIADLNDALRRTFLGGKVYLTRGIAALPSTAQEAIITRVRTFDAFTPDNDLYDEHDFGSFEYGGKTIFFEGTYTHTFSGNPDPTPRYDYNQILYRVDLADPRLKLPE